MNHFLIGNYTRGDEAALFHGNFDSETGTVTITGSTAVCSRPSFLAMHPNRSRVYVVSESASGTDGGGSVHAYAFDPDTRELTALNHRSTGGPGPCHVTVDATGRYAISANYGGGSVSVHPIAQDGSLGDRTDFHQHEGGSNVNPKRQSSPHAHSVNIDPENRFVYCADLGLDQILAYELDPVQGTLTCRHEIPLSPGAGPRHFTFHPIIPVAYAINELASTITVLTRNPADGSLTAIQEISTLPEGYEGRTSTADIHLTPDGRFLYGSNRGHNSLAIYAVDKNRGTLNSIGWAPVPAVPRNFTLDPSAQFVLSGGQDTDTVAAYRIGGDGNLEQTSEADGVSSPVCLCWT